MIRQVTENGTTPNTSSPFEGEERGKVNMRLLRQKL